ncbi:MAG: phosphatase [Rhodocyclaceae bacterium]|nr:MAG: phosphatase [Rhodocyclaceae bacterium]CAG0929131.1 atypical dual specificity phosphatase [Rhodocyclaceae bacterium]
MANTSLSHPLRIDEVQPLSGWGSIGMSLCPGKLQSNALSGNWERDLDLDIDVIRAWGATAVVTLMEMHEHDELSVPDLPEKVWGAEMEWFHLPIVDQHAPDAVFLQRWKTFGGRIVTTLANGGKVFIHCKGGLGRTGTIAACLLIESGMRPAEAMAAVRLARRGTIETLEQERFVLGYEPCFR